MDVCEHCGRVYLVGLRALRLVHIEDDYGEWCEWLCPVCIDELRSLDVEQFAPYRFALYGFWADEAG